MQTMIRTAVRASRPSATSSSILLGRMLSTTVSKAAAPEVPKQATTTIKGKPIAEERPEPSAAALELAKRILTSTEFFNQPQMLKHKKQEVIKSFRRHPMDTGSSEVQIAIMSERILQLQQHFHKNKKDVHSRKGLMELMQSRRSLLLYLEPRDPAAYARVVEKYQIREGTGSSRVTVRPETWSPPRRKEDVKFRPANWHEYKKAASNVLIIKRN